METRVRFAPSPTGQIHIGNIRTAIFNWLFTRNNKGKMLLRVEDTDRERSTQEAIDKLLECMDWLGLDYDEGIMYQSQQATEHIKIAENLLETNLAYYPPEKDDEALPMIFRIPWDSNDINFVRDVGTSEIKTHSDVIVKIDYTGINYAQISKKGKPIPVTSCLAGYKDLKIFDVNDNCIFELNDNIDDIIENKKVIELEICSKFVFTRREVFFNDIIKGELSKPLDSMKDLVIVRSNGSPIFHIANVCDDVKQKVTHIVRGDDHVENTYRHLFLFNAINAEIPQYAHMPMIVNQQGKPYSKRDGDAFVGDFKEKGFLPGSLFNYLSLLGWSPGDDREKLTKTELVELFSLNRVQSSPAQLDTNKLMNMNGMYIAEMDIAKFADLILLQIKKNDWGQNIDDDDFLKVANLMQIRTKSITQLDNWKFFFSDDFEYNEKAIKKQLKKEEIKNGLKALSKTIAELADFTVEKIELELRKAEEEQGLGNYKLNQPLRLAITGSTTGPDLMDTILLLGKNKVIKRIDDLLNKTI